MPTDCMRRAILYLFPENYSHLSLIPMAVFIFTGLFIHIEKNKYFPTSISWADKSQYQAFVRNTLHALSPAYCIQELLLV